jgi:uncharacterized membrane protein
MTQAHPMLQPVRLLSLFSYASLFLLLMAWNTLLAPKPHVPIAVSLLLIVGPLLLPLRGVLNRRPVSHVWIAVISLLYFILGVTSMYSHPELRLLALLETSLSILLFFSALYFARWEAQRLNAHNP